jgi:hypothetical protein
LNVYAKTNDATVYHYNDSYGHEIDATVQKRNGDYGNKKSPAFARDL